VSPVGSTDDATTNDHTEAIDPPAPASLGLGRDAGEDATVTFSGELDVASAPRVRATLDRHVDGDVVVSMTDVSFIDSVAIGVFVGAAQRASEAGHRFVLRDLQPAPRRVIELCGLLDLLVDPDEPARHA